MAFRDRFDAAADRVASLVSSVFVTAPDHPNRGGVTGEAADRGDDQAGESTDGSE